MKNLTRTASALAAAVLLALVARGQEPTPTPSPTPFESYTCTLGTVTNVEGGSYLIATPDGRTIGIAAASGAPSAANVDADIAADAASNALASARAAKLKALFEAASPGVLAAFAALPVGVQAQFEPVKTAALKAASSGDFATAHAVISTCALPVELAATQTALAEQIAPLVAAQAAINAATTPAEVEAVSLATPAPSPTP